MPSLVPPPPPEDNVELAHRDIVPFVEELLAAAKAGDLRSIAVAIECSDGTTTDRWCMRQKAWPVRLLGAIALMQTRLTRRIMEMENEP